MEFRIHIQRDKDKPFDTVLKPTDLNPAESLALMGKLIENLKCKECGGKKRFQSQHPQIDLYDCPSCHSSGKDNEKLVEVVKLCFPEIDRIAADWWLIEIGKAARNQDVSLLTEYLTDYLKEQK